MTWKLVLASRSVRFCPDACCCKTITWLPLTKWNRGIDQIDLPKMEIILFLIALHSEFRNYHNFCAFLNQFFFFCCRWSDTVVFGTCTLNTTYFALDNIGPNRRGPIPISSFCQMQNKIPNFYDAKNHIGFWWVVSTFFVMMRKCLCPAAESAFSCFWPQVLKFYCIVKCPLLSYVSLFVPSTDCCIHCRNDRYHLLDLHAVWLRKQWYVGSHLGHYCNSCSCII